MNELKINTSVVTLSGEATLRWSTEPQDDLLLFNDLRWRKMDTRTGNIVQISEEEEEELKKEIQKGNEPWLVPIPPEDLARVRRMNRNRRKAWARKQRTRKR